MPKKANWRAVKSHRSYTVDEAARSLCVCKGAIRRWIKDGLPTIDNRRPAHILGGDLIYYLKARVRPKQKCKLDECYCFRCRTPKRPAFDEMEYHPTNAKTGNLRALCETCSTVMNKRFSYQKLDQLRAMVTVVVIQNCGLPEQAIPPLNTGTRPSLNDHLKGERVTHAKTSS